MTLSKEQIREVIVKRVAKELNDGDVVTLGIGMPTQVARFISKDIQVFLQSENGILGARALREDETPDSHITDAGGNLVAISQGGCFFDSLTSFAMIRGGHINTTVLGALQVDEKGNLANWLVPNKLVPGMGGAMDLVVGAKRVIVAMEHTSKGESKILKECTLPLTASQEVNLIVTEKCVMEVTSDGLLLKEISSLSNLEDIKNTTQADFKIDKNLKINAY